MQFVFYDKSENELDVIVSVLEREGVRYRIKRNISQRQSSIFRFGTVECNSFDVIVNVSLEYFDYLKKCVEEKINILKKLEFDYELEYQEPKKDTENSSNSATPKSFDFSEVESRLCKILSNSWETPNFSYGVNIHIIKPEDDNNE